MYLEDLVKRSYIKSDPATDEEITLLLAGCRPQVDQHLVVSKSDFETVLMENRATDPTSEAVLMTIGRSGITPGDPIWDVMLGRDCVVSHYTKLCNDAAAAELSALDEADKAASGNGLGMNTPPEVDTIPPSSFGGGVELTPPAAEPTLGGTEFIPPPAVEAAVSHSPFSSDEFDVIEGAGDEGTDEAAHEEAPAADAAGTDFENFGFGAAQATAPPATPGPEPEPKPEPVAEQVVPAAPDVTSSIVIKPSKESDGMDIYLDDASKHRPYVADVAPDEEYKDAPAPGSVIGAAASEPTPPPMDAVVDEPVPLANLTGKDTASGMALGFEGVSPKDAALASDGLGDIMPSVEFGGSATGIEFGGADTAVPASGIEFGGGDTAGIEFGGGAKDSFVPGAPPEDASIFTPDERFKDAPPTQNMDGSMPSPGVDSMFGFPPVGATAPMPGDGVLVESDGEGPAVEFGGGGFVPFGDDATQPAPVPGAEAGEPPLADMSGADEGEDDEPPLADMSGSDGVGSLMGSHTAPPMDGDLPPVFDTSAGGGYDMSDRTPDPTPTAPATETFDIPDPVTPPAPPSPEEMPKQVYDMPGYVPPKPVEETAIEHFEAPESDGGERQRPGFRQVEAPASAVEESAPTPDVEETPVQQPVENAAEYIATIKSAFELFNQLEKQYTMEVILASENLTPEQFCLQLVETFPQFGDQYQTSLATHAGNYNKVVRDLVQSLQLEAESAVHTGNLDRAEECIAPVCKLIYS